MTAQRDACRGARRHLGRNSVVVESGRRRRSAGCAFGDAAPALLRARLALLPPGRRERERGASRPRAARRHLLERRVEAAEALNLIGGDGLQKALLGRGREQGGGIERASAGHARDGEAADAIRR